MMLTQHVPSRSGMLVKRAVGIVWATLVLTGLGLFGCGPVSHESPVVVIVNGRPITLGEFEFRWSELSESTQARYRNEGGKQKFLDDLISRELLMQEARKLGLDKSLIVRQQTQRFKEQLLLDEVMREVVKTQVEVSQEELKGYYASHGAVLPAPDQIEVSQIVSINIYAAKDIKRMLNEGADFAKLARRYSADQFSKEKGGNVGFYQKGSAPPEVEAAVYKLRPGRVSDPIKSEAGFYIVKVTSRRPGDTKAIFAARKQLKQELYAEKRQNQIQDYLAKLKTTASIRIDDASKYVTQETRVFKGSFSP